MKEKSRIEERKKRRAEKKKHGVLKGILITLGVIIIALGAFVATIMICKPDFDFVSLVPKSVTTFFETNIQKSTAPEGTTINIAEKTSAVTTTKREYLSYAESSDFAFDTSKQGNQIGNILNKTSGAITYNSSYIYFAKPGSGIYRFTPSDESSAKMTDKYKKISDLNILDSYLYFVDKTNDKLIRFDVSQNNGMPIASGIQKIYLYNDKIFYISTDNAVGFISLKDNSSTVLYTAQGGTTISLVGISLSRVFFTEEDDVTNEVTYYSVNQKDANDIGEFREPTEGNEIKSMEIENGFMYYYQKMEDNTYDLVRQKFGSQNVVALREDINTTDYVVVYQNRLYFTETNDNKVQAKELNMNSNKVKTMLTVSDADTSGSLGVGYGYQYVFLLGTKTDGGSKTYKGSCIYTSASSDNTMTFKDGKWRY